MKKLLLALLLSTSGCTVHTMRTTEPMMVYYQPVYPQSLSYNPMYTPRRHVVHYYAGPVAQQCTNLVQATCDARGW